jgi:hypothetical protein
MIRKAMIALLVCLFAAPLLSQAVPVTPPAASPVWLTVTPESATISVTLPAGATYRFGDYTNNLWSVSVTVQAATTISPVSMSAADPFPFADPDYGTLKELDVLETAASQTLSISDLTLTPPAPVSFIVPALTPPTTLPVLPGSLHTVTFTNFVNADVYPSTATLMFAFVNGAANLADETWEGTSMNLTIDGVVLTCTYGQTYTDQVFSLSCTVPAAAQP